MDSRRSFLKNSLYLVGGALLLSKGIIQSSADNTALTSSGETVRFATESGIPRPPSGGTNTFPQGNRLIRIRVLNDDQSWENAMGDYTTDTVLGWISDLQPTTLNRYFSGPQDSTQVLPGSQNLTVQEFLQASIDACFNTNSTTLFPRLSFDYYAAGTFLEYAQLLFD